MLTERPGHIELATNKTVLETQLSLTNRATHLCKRNGVGPTTQNTPVTICVIIVNLVDLR